MHSLQSRWRLSGVFKFIPAAASSLQKKAAAVSSCHWKTNINKTSLTLSQYFPPRKSLRKCRFSVVADRKPYARSDAAINMNYKFDTSDLTRRLKRTFDGNLSYRKLFLLLFVVAVFLLYIGPSFLRWLFGHTEPARDQPMRCMDDRLTPFYLQNLEYNVNIRHQPAFPHEHDAIPYVGNGWFGLEIQTDAHLNIFHGRALLQPINFHPIVSVASTGQPAREATVVEYLTGIVHRFQCFPDGYHVSYQYYAHRTMPSVLVQEIQLTNTKNQLTDIELIVPRISDWPSAIVKNVRLQHGSAILEYQVVTGMVDVLPMVGNVEDSKVRVVSIVARKLPRVITLKKRGTTKLELLLTVNYSDPMPRDKYAGQKETIEKQAIDAMNRALLAAEHGEHNAYHNFKRDHILVWNNLWETGFHISTSKAENTLNGNNINATMYAVISHTRAYEFEQSVTAGRKEEIARSLTYAEGCYDSYHTLQAENLWRPMTTFEELNAVVGSWMLTLEKQGCHNLIKAGASGIVQAMVLSFGGFRFSNQHLELNIHPKYLHRDYDFRRLNYGNMTHLNISITVRDDNKAVLYVALDRSDRNYYACDAGCLDDPVQLRQSRAIFPVKLTEPVTSILYITSDKKHMEDLRHAIHVKEVVEAPAHEHHVIALHRHGHHLGGLPTLFWVSICVIIIVFHVFLCKLIVKEYCEPPDKMRYRYSKP